MGRITFFIAYSIIVLSFLYFLTPFCNLLANAIREFVKKMLDVAKEKKNKGGKR